MRKPIHRELRMSVGGGYVLQAAVQVVLLLAVLGQVTFLAGHYRSRIDLTHDGLYTLTDSTKEVLASLDQRLVIEAYFSRGDKLGASFQEGRRSIDNFLAELVEESKGRIQVEKLDPQEDESIRNQAERLGIRPAQLNDVGDSSLSVNLVYQGLRLLYGGERQEVIPLVAFQAYPTMYEMAITPRIKALTVEKKPVLGMLAFPTESTAGRGPRGAPSHRFDELAQYVKNDFDVVNVDLSNRQLVPDDIRVLLVIRPKGLNDRQKYALDQFLMRGGHLVVFADTAEVEIGQQRTMRTQRVSYDAAQAKLAFLDQLAHYGVQVDEKVVVDFVGRLGAKLVEARSSEPFNVVLQTMGGAQLATLEYPYWFHAAPVDYAEHAEALASMEPGEGDGIEERIERYREQFKPGVDLDNVALGAMNRGPGMFWPCPVELRPELPAGVTGKTLLRSSPLSYLEDPPPNFNPLGASQGNWRAAYNTFFTRTQQRLNSEPRQQHGLMVHLEGTFPSFFAGQRVPPRRLPEKGEVEPDGGDPLAEPIVETPPTVEDPAGEKPPGGPSDPLSDPAAPDPLLAGSAAGQSPQESEGKEQDPEPLLAAPATAKLTVIGDATFLRDDLRPVLGQAGAQSAEYGQLGPLSQFGPTFFVNLVDWIAGDQELLALRNMQLPDRSLYFADDDLQVERDRYLAQIKSREQTVTLLNWAGPPFAIFVIWLLAALRRRAVKQSFLASVQG